MTFGTTLVHYHDKSPYNVAHKCTYQIASDSISCARTVAPRWDQLRDQAAIYIILWQYSPYNNPQIPQHEVGYRFCAPVGGSEYCFGTVNTWLRSCYQGESAGQ